MAVVASRDAYFETGLEVLSDLGYGGLKLAVVCNRLGVTTGSFYHYFPSWSEYTRALVEYWAQTRRVNIEAASAEPDPRRRIDNFIQTARVLQHRCEAAIRVWSSIDPTVHDVHSAVERQRFDVVFQAAFEILENKHQAQIFASWSMYVLIGYEQSTLPRNPKDLEWIGSQLLDALDSGRFGSVPDDG